jgi:hypothetical protein
VRSFALCGLRSTPFLNSGLSQAGVRNGGGVAALHPSSFRSNLHEVCSPLLHLLLCVRGPPVRSTLERACLGLGLVRRCGQSWSSASLRASDRPDQGCPTSTEILPISKPEQIDSKMQARFLSAFGMALNKSGRAPCVPVNGDLQICSKHH